MKKLILSIVISLIISGGAVAAVSQYFSDIHYIDKEGAAVIYFNNPNYLALPENEPFTFEQEIIASQNNLSKITLFVKNTGALALSATLYGPSSAMPLREDNISTSQTGPTTPIDWIFEPLTDSSGQTYTIRIQGIAGPDGLSFPTIEPARYDGGLFLWNGKTVETERLSIDWQYYTPNAWQSLLHRLIFAKPGIFNYVQTWEILISVFILMNAACLTLVLLLLFTIGTKRN
ncbi:MAG: hypothetical protein WC544_03720 [Patescibacteria group bacterium]